MALTISLFALSVMAVIALRADRHFADHSDLPMNFGFDGSPGWRAPRRVALWFMPGLAAVVLLPIAFALPDVNGATIGAVAFLGGQALHLYLIGRTL